MSVDRHPLPPPVPAAFPVDGEAARAVVRTVTYASLFQAPLTRERLHRTLMDVRLDPRALDDVLADPWVRARLETSGDLVFPRGKGDWIETRRARRAETERLLRRHRRALALVARCPFVRLLGLSGACAHENASDGDVDIFLVTRGGRAWAVYLALVVANLAATVALVQGLTTAGLDYLVAKVLTAALLSVVNYLVSKRWIFT